MIENMTLKDLTILLKMLDVNKKETIPHNGEEIRIVILQRGWVIVGNYYQEGSYCRIENGHVIRRWGTTKGLGELATEGKKENTILDPIPTTKFHELTVVASMICDKSKW